VVRAPAFAELAKFFEDKKSPLALLSPIRKYLAKRIMSNLNYALFEAPVGYALFKVVHQVDSIALKSQDARDATSDLAKFGKMVKLVNFSPFRCDPTSC
jgi:hypothetical protein